MFMPKVEKAWEQYRFDKQEECWITHWLPQPAPEPEPEPDDEDDPEP